MDKTKTTDYTLSLSKHFGRLWMLDDITPFYKKFQNHFSGEMGGDYLKITTCGAGNHVLDILAGEDRDMEIELRISPERVKLPGYVEFELASEGKMAAKYYVNDCPGVPQLAAWFNVSVKEIVKGFPPFAYIRRKQI